MYENIIQQAMAEMVAGYEIIIERYLEEKDFAVFNTEIKEESVRLGASIVKKVIEEINRMLRDSRERRAKGWYVVKDDRRTILTSLGNVCFERTLFINHNTNERIKGEYNGNDIGKIQEQKRSDQIHEND